MEANDVCGISPHRPRHIFPTLGPGGYPILVIGLAKYDSVTRIMDRPRGSIGPTVVEFGSVGDSPRHRRKNRHRSALFERAENENTTRNSAIWLLRGHSRVRRLRARWTDVTDGGWRRGGGAECLVRFVGG